MSFHTCTTCHGIRIPSRDMVKNSSICKNCKRPKSRPLKSASSYMKKRDKQSAKFNFAVKMYNLFKVKK